MGQSGWKGEDSGDVHHRSPVRTQKDGRPRRGTMPVVAFKGTFQHTLDEKGRLLLPARYRELFSPAFVLTRGLEGCLYVYTLDVWDKVLELFPQEPLFGNPDRRTFTRLFLSGALDCTLDRQGRVLIPDYLLKHAGLEREKECVFVGALDHLEIWDRDRWSQFEERGMERYDELAASMGGPKAEARGDAR